MSEFTIIRDTKEQKPLGFIDYPVKITNESLPAGDYSLVGHDMPGDDDSIIIERKKDCMELCSNLGAKWEQFENEAKLLKKYKHKMILVCAPNNFDYLCDRGFTKLSVNFIYKRLAYLYVNYGITITYMPNRESAENLIYRTFLEIIRKTREEN